MRTPADAEVARLVGLRNIFTGEVVAHEPLARRTRLRWDGIVLEVAHRPDFPPGARVEWIIPAADVILHRRDRPSRGEHENPVPGRIVECLPLGDAAHLALEPAAVPNQRIAFSLPLHTARRNGLALGVEATVSLLASGVHVMLRAPS
jgi:molybdate transport system ATP-binding protein